MKKAVSIIFTMCLFASLAIAQRQTEVIAEVALTNQSGTIGGTLYTPVSTELFRVTIMLQCTRGNGQASQLFPIFTFTDDNGPEFFEFNSVQDGQPYPPITSTGIFKIIGGSPLNWEVQALPGDTSEYEVYIVLERIAPKIH